MACNLGITLLQVLYHLNMSLTLWNSEDGGMGCWVVEIDQGFDSFELQMMEKRGKLGDMESDKMMSSVPDA
jgi:hypothetical protein